MVMTHGCKLLQMPGNERKRILRLPAAAGLGGAVTRKRERGSEPSYSCVSSKAAVAEPLTWPIALVWRVARRQAPAGKAFAVALK